MSREVFLDSGAFIAFLDRSDQLHDHVAALFARPPKRWRTLEKTRRSKTRCADSTGHEVLPAAASAWV